MKYISLIGVVLVLVAAPAVLAVSERYAQANEDYFFQLENFRVKYDEFLIKRETFDLSGTFAAQEELVTAAREMLGARDFTWRTYFNALRTDVTDSQGLTADEKVKLEPQLSAEEKFLDEHRLALSPLTERLQLLDQADLVNAKAETYTTLAYSTLISLKIAKTRTAKNEMAYTERLLKEAVTIQIREATVREVRLRGFAEIETLLSQVEEELTKVTNDVNQFGESYANKTGYDQTVLALAPTYQKLERVLQLLKELSTGIEL